MANPRRRNLYNKRQCTASQTNMSRVLNNQGYTLVESLFQFIIFMILTHLVVLFFLWKAPIEKQYKESSSGEWELFSLELQELLEEVEFISETKQQTAVAFQTERGVITIESYGSLIRKLVDGAGHVPLLTNVKTATFEVEEYELTAAFEMLDGTKRVRTFAVGYIAE